MKRASLLDGLSYCLLLSGGVSLCIHGGTFGSLAGGLALGIFAMRLYLRTTDDE